MNSYEGEQWGISKIQTLNFSFTWTIHNFSFNNKEIGQSLSSPTFDTPGKEDFKWKLTLYPKGNKEERKDYISIFLHLTTGVNPNINTKVTFSILNNKNEEKYTNSFPYTFKKRNGHGLVTFIKQSVLFNPVNDLLLDDKLRIVCRVIAGVGIVENCFQDIVKFEDKRNKFSLSSELGSLFKNKYMTDVTLIADGKELQAHKTILAARSSVFLAMLEADMQEKQNSKIEFVDVSFDVLNEMLQYLYTGTVKNIKKYAYDLVKVADKYDIKGLKSMCEEWFYKELSINSAITLFILADKHNCDVLRPLILKFIIAHAKDILKTVEFKKFEKDLPILIKEMIHAIV